MIVDTSALLAALFSDQNRHAECAEVLVASSQRIVSPFVLAELDYLVERHAGVAAELVLLEDVARGAYELAQMTPADVRSAAEIVARFADLGIGLSAASIVVLADRYQTREVFTLDERHFRTLRTARGHRFRLLPADA